MRGADRESSRTRGGMRWTRKLRLTSVTRADGEVVWSWRPTLALSLLKQFGRRRWQKSSAHRGEREISRKTIAQGKPDASAGPVCSCAFFPCAFCTRDRGCSAHPAFPAPSCFLGVKIDAKLGRIAPRECRRTSSRCLKVESATLATNSTSSLRTQGPITTTVSDVAKPSNNVFLLQAARRMSPCVRRDDKLMGFRSRRIFLFYSYPAVAWTGTPSAASAAKIRAHERMPL